MLLRLISIILLISGTPLGLAYAQEIQPSEAADDAPEAPPVPQQGKMAITQAPDSIPTPKLPDDKNDEPQPVYNAVELQSLNKVTGHISKLEGPLGEVMNFGTLEIIAKRCWKSPPDERPENAGLLEIREMQPGEGPKRIFLGWMFSSSPGLSGLEHAVYDISMLSCEYDPKLVKKAEPTPEPKPEQAKGKKPAAAKKSTKPAAKKLEKPKAPAKSDKPSN